MGFIKTLISAGEVKMVDKSITIQKRAGCGNIHLTITDGSSTGHPMIAITGGKEGTCLAAQLRTISYCLTLALRHGATVEEVASTIEFISCPQSMIATKGPTSCGDAIARILKGATEK